jgi:hypothetical protein
MGRADGIHWRTGPEPSGKDGEKDPILKVLPRDAPTIICEPEAQWHWAAVAGRRNGLTLWRAIPEQNKRPAKLKYNASKMADVIFVNIDAHHDRTGEWPSDVLLLNELCLNYERGDNNDDTDSSAWPEMYRTLAKFLNDLLDECEDRDLHRSGMMRFWFPGWSPGHGHRENVDIWGPVAARYDGIVYHSYTTADGITDETLWYIDQFPAHRLCLGEWDMYNCPWDWHEEEAKTRSRLRSLCDAYTQLYACYFIYAWGGGDTRDYDIQGNDQRMRLWDGRETLPVDDWQPSGETPPPEPPSPPEPDPTPPPEPEPIPEPTPVEPAMIDLTPDQLRAQWGARGLWFWDKRNDGRSWDEIAQDAIAKGYDALYIKASDGGRIWDWQWNTDMFTKLTTAGLKVAGWHYVYGDHPEDEGSAILTAANIVPGTAQIIDVEYEWLQARQSNSSVDQQFFTAIVGPDLAPNTGLAYAPDIRIAFANRWPTERTVRQDGGGMDWTLWNTICRGGVMPQTYYHTFELSAQTGVWDLIQAWLNGYVDAPSIMPILDVGDDTIATGASLLNSYPSISIWRDDPSGAPYIATTAPPEPAPSPEPSPTPDPTPAPAPGPSAPIYNPAFPPIRQDKSYDCSETALLWILYAYGRQTSDAWLEGAMQSEGVLTERWGLMDATGHQLADFINEQYDELGYIARAASPVSFDDVANGAGLHGRMAGGINWVHWVAVTGYDGARDVLTIMNPAPGYMGIYGELTRNQFSQLGPFSMIDVSAKDAPIKPVTPETPVPTQAEILQAKIDQLQAAYTNLQAQLDGVLTKLGVASVDYVKALEVGGPKVHSSADTISQALTKIEGITRSAAVKAQLDTIRAANNDVRNVIDHDYEPVIDALRKLNPNLEASS